MKYSAVQTKTCHTAPCPSGHCSWWEFLDGEVFKGIPSDGVTHCYEDNNLLPLMAQKYFVGMGHEYINNISPVKSVCGACLLFTTLEGKVN